MSASPPHPDPSRPAASRVPTVVATVAGVVLVLLWARRLTTRTFVWEVWSDRDLARAILEPWPTHGAELSFLGELRVPGGFYAWLLKVPTSLSTDPWTAYAFGLVLAVIALFVTGAATRAVAGSVAGVLAAAGAGMMAWDWDARRTVWNPTYLPLPLAIATAAVLLGVGRGRRTLPVAALAVALGAQLHLSAASWGLAVGLAALLVGGRPRAREVALAVAAVLLVYAPWLAEQAASGFPDLRGHHAVAPSGTVVDGIGRLAVELLVGERPLVPVVVLAALWAVPALGAGVTAVLGVVRRRASDADRAVAALALGTLAHVVAMAGFGGGAEPRYVVVAGPALGVLAGVGTAKALARAPWPTALVALPAIVAMGLDLSATLVPAEGQLHRTDLRARALDAAAQALGGDARDVAGRTWLGGERGPKALDGTAADLAWAGEAFPGSGAPPCVLVTPTSSLPPTDRLADTVAGWLGAPPGFAVQRVDDLGDGLSLLVYATSGRCRTSLSNRYVDTPAEAVARALRGTIPCGREARLDGGRTVAMLDAAPPGAGCRAVPVVADAVVEGGALAVTLHGNALRGHAYYGGWFTEARLLDAVVVVEGVAGRREAPLATGAIGHGGDLAPVSAAPIRLGPGDAAWIAGRVRTVEEGAPSDDADARPFRIPLVTPGP